MLTSIKEIEMLGQCARCGRTVNHSKVGKAFRHKVLEGVDAPWCKETEELDSPTEELLAVLEDPTPAPLPSIKGPWFTAEYLGTCATCFEPFEAGDEIRADGEGGYECEDCVDPIGAVTRAPTYQEQASAAAKRHLAGMRPASQVVDEAQEIPVPVVITTFSPDPFEDPTESGELLNVSGQPKARYQWRGNQNMGYLVKDPETGDFRRYKNGSVQGWTRATTFNKAASDRTGLTAWSQRNIVVGAGLRPDLLLGAHGVDKETPEGKKILNAIVAELEATAGANTGSDMGTYIHGFTEDMDGGRKEPTDAPERFREQLELYRRRLAEDGFEIVPGLIERTTGIREFGGVVGTFDRVLFHRPSGRYMVADVKTAKTMDYARDETFCQMWVYAHGINQNGLYDWNTDTWGPVGDPMTQGPHPDGVPITVSTTTGLIIHMPVAGDDAGTVTLEKADLVKGAEYAELCARVRANKKPRKELWSWTPPAAAEGLQNPTDPVVWDHLFASVQSGADAGELWERAREAGVPGLELNRLVQIAQDALRVRG